MDEKEQEATVVEILSPNPKHVWKVDAYVNHDKLEDIMNERFNNGWVLFRLMENKPNSQGCEFCTLIWAVKQK